jgi:DNA modification methylase
MRKLSEQEIEMIISLLREGKPLPENYKAYLFDTKKEYELIYADKEREEDVLADTMYVPLQPVKIFRNGENDNGWMNMLIFGDNLQVLKTLLQMKQEGKLKNFDGTPGVKLVYIDPPFATKQEFRGSQDQKAYQDKIAGAMFVEFIRRRLVFLKELLSEDGYIFVHLDMRKQHYIKMILDELFGENSFINEIIWKRTFSHGDIGQGAEHLGRLHDVILFYRRQSSSKLNPVYVPYSEKYLRDFYKYTDSDGRKYRLVSLLGPGGASKGNPYYEFMGVTRYWVHSKEKMEQLLKRGLIIQTKPGSVPQKKRYLDESEGVSLQDIWTDIPPIQGGSLEKLNYPTQKPEALLERIISTATAKKDLILDAFAGSGTTLAVAEKLDRRWIGIDCGKLAIYTMQKRLLNIADSKDLENSKKKYGKTCTSFTLYNAGLYDYKMIKELPWDEYRDFALKLFQCQDKRHEISKIELDGFMGADNVLIFNYQKHKDAVMDRDFIDDLHKYLGSKISERFFIIAPAVSVQFLEDYIEKGKTKYFILRIPYSIIEEIHTRGFSKIKQPVSEMDVNDTVNAVGFDFIQVPTVVCKYFLNKPKKSDLFNQKTKECVIKIEKFESRIISRKPLKFANLETLSMVMLNYNFNNEVFNLDEVIYAEDLKKNDYEVRFTQDKVKGKIMIIYVDIFGNEKREIKTISDFNSTRKK